MDRRPFAIEVRGVTPTGRANPREIVPAQIIDGDTVAGPRTGVQILKRALEAPARQIAENSAVDGGVVVARMLGGQGNHGFDAARKEYVDLVDAGIIDPTKVVRIGLENACSVAHRSDDDGDSRGQEGTQP